MTELVHRHGQKNALQGGAESGSVKCDRDTQSNRDRAYAKFPFEFRIINVLPRVRQSLGFNCVIGIVHFDHDGSQFGGRGASVGFDRLGLGIIGAAARANRAVVTGSGTPRAGGCHFSVGLRSNVCESGDWIGRDRALAAQPGDLLAVLSAGAYCMSMASNYNTRGRAAEVLVDGARANVIRERETPADQMRHEKLL